GQGEARAVLRSGGAGRGARCRGRAHVRSGLGRRILCHGARRELEGFAVMDAGMPVGQVPAAAAGDFFARARARLTLDVPAGLSDPSVIPRRGDHDIDPAVVKAIAAVRPIRPAAVLVPVVARAEPMVLLTQRTAHLKDHAGQISFPGGKIEQGDASPAAAALREAEEEIALSPRLVEPIGYLDIHMTTRGYRIVPTLARVAP